MHSCIQQLLKSYCFIQVIRLLFVFSFSLTPTSYSHCRDFYPRQMARLLSEEEEGEAEEEVCSNTQLIGGVLAWISTMPVQNSNSKIFALPDFATNLLEILTPTIFNSLVCQKRQFALQPYPEHLMVCQENIWLLHPKGLN